MVAGLYVGEEEEGGGWGGGEGGRGRSWEELGRGGLGVGEEEREVVVSGVVGLGFLAGGFRGSGSRV